MPKKKKQRKEYQTPEIKMIPALKYFDALAFAHIDRKLFAAEAELMRVKWFDYRDLHPTAATLKFWNDYTKAYRASYAKRVDYKRARYILPAKGTKQGLFEAAAKNTYTGIWKARQNADKRGIPYHLYCIYAMDFADNNIWRNVPRPQQLYSKDMSVYIDERWEEDKTTRVILPAIKRDVALAGYLDYIAEIVSKRRIQTYIIKSLITYDEAITRQQAVQLFGEEAVKSALALDFDLTNQEVINDR